VIGACPLCGKRPPLFAGLTDCARCAILAGDSRPAPVLDQEEAHQEEDTRPVILFLVACSAKKGASPAPARDLYQGPEYRAARRYVEAHQEEAHPGTRVDWMILSALHHAIEPDATIAPYDARIPQATGDHYRWGQHAAGTIRLKYGRRLSRVVILAPAAYADGVRPHLEAIGADVEEPLRGLGQGYRLGWFKARRAQVSP